MAGNPGEAEERLRAEAEALAAEDRDTAKLIERVQAGDRELFGEVYKRYFDRVFTYLTTVIEDRHEAENVAQDVFLKALCALPGYELQVGTPFRHWLFRIARNHARNMLRDLGRVQVEDPHTIALRRESAAAQDDDDGIELELITDVDLLVLIRQLPQAQRKVLVLRYVLDLPYAEVGREIGRSAEAARKLHERAIEFLRERLEVLQEKVKENDTSEQPLRDQPRSRRVFRQARVLRRRKFALTDPD